MLTNLTIRNFKRFEDVEIELGSPVVFIGPNNSGKTSAMQALSLWGVGLKRWNERRGGTSVPARRPGVTVNRRDLVAIPAPVANLLWRELHTRNVYKVDGRQQTDNIRIEVVVKGIGNSGEWSCGLEFDYANEESFYCRPLRLDSGRTPERMPVPSEASDVEVAFLPPMSGLAATETRLDPGAVNVRVGEGRTAEVLRNLCFRIYEEEPEQWQKLGEQIDSLFGAQLDPPRYVDERGEITMTYRERGVSLDLASSGRGLQQTLLILAYMYANPGAVLLLDEPDAHLEILRQRQIYRVITDAAEESGSQIIAASHSEVLLNEAAGNDTVVAFVGNPHRIDDRGSQVLKALQEIGFEQYVLGEQTGWVLYLEGSTDLAILQAFARRLGHEDAQRALERPFVHYVGNQLRQAQNHYYGLREALPELCGIAILDEVVGEPSGDGLAWLAWQRREIENYLCTRSTLEEYAAASARSYIDADESGPLFGPLVEPEVARRVDAMREAIDEVESAMETLGRGSPWDPDAKVSDDFLEPLFAAYFRNLHLPNLMNKTNFHQLVPFVLDEEIDSEVREKLDRIVEASDSAQTVSGS
ncbi:MAG: AAA family ATPase [Chloroflexi bacterium]|nr:AAA family ATPase [Chloroflexota bacterium]